MLVSFLSIFCSGVNTLCLFGVSDSVVSNVPLCWVYLVQKVERRLDRPPFGWEFAMAGRSGSFPLLQRCASIFQATDALALDTTSPASQILEKHIEPPAAKTVFAWPDVELRVPVGCECSKGEWGSSEMCIVSMAVSEMCIVSIAVSEMCIVSMAVSETNDMSRDVFFPCCDEGTEVYWS